MPACGRKADHATLHCCRATPTIVQFPHPSHCHSESRRLLPGRRTSVIPRCVSESELRTSFVPRKSVVPQDDCMEAARRSPHLPLSASMWRAHNVPRAPYPLSNGRLAHSRAWPGRPCHVPSRAQTAQADGPRQLGNRSEAFTAPRTSSAPLRRALPGRSSRRGLTTR